MVAQLAKQCAYVMWGPRSALPHQIFLGVKLKIYLMHGKMMSSKLHWKSLQLEHFFQTRKRIKQIS
jgi:hypothetical protein